MNSGRARVVVAGEEVVEVSVEELAIEEGEEKGGGGGGVVDAQTVHHG